MMNDALCTYDDRRDEVLVAYLYDDIDPVERSAFERHLPTCLSCRTELEGLREIRDGLSGWAAPEVTAGVGGRPSRTALRLVDTPQRPSAWRALAEAPIWLQAAAAMLVIAGSVGLANINLTYSKDGLSITTGWIRPTPSSPASATQSAGPAVPAQAVATPWRAEMTAMEERIFQELKARPAAATASGPADDDALLKRVRALIQESEQRQQRELALRVAEVARDAQTQRQADLVKIDRSLGLIQSRTGVEVMRTQQQLNNLALRVSEQR